MVAKRNGKKREIIENLIKYLQNSNEKYKSIKHVIFEMYRACSIRQSKNSERKAMTQRCGFNTHVNTKLAFLFVTYFDNRKTNHLCRTSIATV